MGIYRWKLKTLVKVTVLLFFLCMSMITINFLSEKSQKTHLINKVLGSRNVKDMVQPFTDTFLINNHWQNGDIHHYRVTDKENVFLVVVITSLPENENRRNIIRSSWMKYNPNKNTIVVFFSGRPQSYGISKLQLESDKHGDLIVDDFDENYYSLSVKTLRILKWFIMNLPKANFLVKTDDDVYVNTPLLIEHLVSINDKIRSDTGGDVINYLGGVIASGRSPHTLNSFSKWYVPPNLWRDQKIEIESIKKNLYNHDGYPEYLEGNFYAISGFTVPLILNASVNLPLYHLEDVYVTGLIGSEILQIKLASISHIFTDSASWPRLNYFYNKLFISPKNIIAYHCDNQVQIVKQLYDESC